MAGNLRSKAGDNAAKVDRAYQKARQVAKRRSSICHVCGDAIAELKSICVHVCTDGIPVERAHEIPRECGDADCKRLHTRKPNPWSWSADHKIPVADLPPDSPLLTSADNLLPSHLICNKRRNRYGDKAPRERFRTSRDWFQ